jgi:hypothetical protein
MPFNKFVERDFPHIVEIIVPKTGKSSKLDAMNDFHVRHSIKPHRTHGRYKDGCRYIRWCFADRETAEVVCNKVCEGRAKRRATNVALVSEKSKNAFRTSLKPMCR